MIRQNNLRETLISLGFEEVGDNKYDRYFSSADCHVVVDFAAESIIYPEQLKYERTTTLNFSQAENFVVLDCVCRLLALGYKPKHLHLEAGVPGGHDDNKAGYADILVSVNQLFQCLRGHSQQCYVRISLNTDGHTVVFGEDKRRCYNVAGLQSAHFHLLSAERSHATNQRTFDHNVGKTAGHAGQGIDIALLKAHDLIVDAAQSQFYTHFAHAHEKRTLAQGMHDKIIHHRGKILN